MHRRLFWMLAVTGLLAGCAGGPPDAQVAAPRHHFGELLQYAAAEHVFIVHNAGGQTLRLVEVSDASPGTQSEILTREVPPGGQGQVRVVFETSGFAGERENAVIVTTNDPDQPLVELSAAGTVVVDLAVEPRVHHLDEAAAGPTVTVTTLLTNRTDHPVRLVGVELPGPDVTLPDPPFARLTPDLPLELQPGQTVSLRMAAVPPSPSEARFSREVVVHAMGARPGTFPILLLGRYEDE